MRRKTHSFWMSAFFLAVHASWAFYNISQKHALIYSVFVKSNENASAEGASEKYIQWPR